MNRCNFPLFSCLGFITIRFDFRGASQRERTKIKPNELLVDWGLPIRNNVNDWYREKQQIIPQNPVRREINCYKRAVLGKQTSFTHAIWDEISFCSLSACYFMSIRHKALVVIMFCYVFTFPRHPQVLYRPNTVLTCYSHEYQMQSFRSYCVLICFHFFSPS